MISTPTSGTIVLGKCLSLSPPHANTHQNNGSDEINVTGLSGLLGDPQTPTSHASTHITGGSDVISNFSSSKSGLVPASGGGTANFLRADGSWIVPPASTINNELIESSFNSSTLSFNHVLIRNKYLDNNLSTDMCEMFTFTAVDTGAGTVTVSDLPAGIDLINTSSGKPWVMMIIESNNGSYDPGQGGDYTTYLRIDAVDTSTKVINYTKFGSGSDPSVGNHFVYFNPWEDGFERDSNNPIIEATDFPTLLGGHSGFVSQSAYMWKQDGTFVLFITVKDVVLGKYYLAYATTTDFSTWSVYDGEIFATGRPSWASEWMILQGEAEYLENEGMYFIYAKVYDGTHQYSGWVKFTEDFSTYEFSPDPIISKEEIDYFLPDYIDVNNYYSAYVNVVKNGGEYIMMSLLYSKFVGTHTGGNGVTTLVDSTAHFESGTLAMLQGTPVKNITKSTSGTISDNTETTVTTSISFDNGDSYEIDDVITRRIVIATSNSRYGPFRIQKIIPMRSYVNDGSCGSRWLEPNQLFVYKGEIYTIFGASAKYKNSGTYGNRAAALFKMTRDYDLVSLQFNPFFTGLTYMDHLGYTEITWEADHLGFTHLIVDESNNKLRVIYDATYGTDNYKIGVASKDLSSIE